MPLVPTEHGTEEINEVTTPLREDPKFAAGKIAFLQYVMIATVLYLVVGFWDLQIYHRDMYEEAAERNRVKSLPVLAPRGKILDRDGRVIVDNHQSFSLLLSRENLKMEHVRPIAEGLNLDYDELLSKLKRYDRTRPKYEPIIIKEELSPGELSFVEAHRNAEGFPEMELIQSQRRVYPADGLAAHAMGYVSEVSETELNTAEFARFKPGDVVGKAGIERQYNDILMGVDGQRQVVVDNRGNIRHVLGMKDATSGKSLQLTVDLDLQVVAELTMENFQGAVVALDPRNGEVLAMVSRPSFDPNKFAGRISTKDWQEITSNPDNPLFNRAIQAQLAPGSTFKPIMAIAGLDSGTVDPTWGVNCPGYATFFGHTHGCWRKGGHGHVSLHGAIAQSCDVYFYNLGNKLGIDKIAEYATMAGFGQKTGIDLPHEAEGIVPSTKWKIRTQRQKWYAGETISVAIGQGALTVTPIQLATAIGGLAMGGAWRRPHFVRDPSQSEIVRRADWNVDSLIEVIDGMYAAVNEGGTGAVARLPSVEVCGKTGTAQLVSNEAIKSGRVAKVKDNAWFVGFAPRRDPEIVVVALFESGEHGNLAAPIVRDVLKAYFDKKARAAKPMLAARPLLTPPTPPQATP